MSLLDAGKVAEALRELEVLASLAASPEDKGSLLLNQVVCLSRLGRPREARARWRESVACGVDVYTDYADICLCIDEKKTDEALDKLTQFLQGHEDLSQSGDEELYSEAAERLGCLLFDLQRYSAAIRPIKEALTIPETDDRKRKLYLYLAICYIQTEDFEAAERVFSEHLSTNHEDSLWPTIQYQSGRLYFKKGAYARARTSFELCQLSAGPDEELRASASLWLAEIADRFPPGKPRVA